MTDGDPTRWSESGGGAPPELEALLRAARRDVPAAREMRALGLTATTIAATCASGTTGGGVGSLASAKAAGTTAASAARASSYLGSSAALAKVGGAALLVAGATTGVWATLSSTGEQAPSTPLVVGSGSASVGATEVTPVAEDASEAESPLPLGLPEPGPATQPDAAQPELAEQQGSPPRSGPSGDRGTRGKSELDLLRAAQSALRSDPGRALELTRQHRISFPAGQLSQEREVIRIEALRRLGRANEASSAERRFERVYPESAHRSKLDSAETPAPPPSKSSQP